MIVLVALCRPAEAGRHVVARGETLERVARAYGCTADAVLRANHLTTTIVPPGTVVQIPPCPRAAARAPVRTAAAPAATAASADDDRARRALATIDARAGTSPAAATAVAESVGVPWNGRLRGGARLPQGEGYHVRRPENAFGATHVVEHVLGAITSVRALYPDLHPLAIGDLSAPRGGPLAEHHSHQSGLDIDVGFFFHAQPAGYPAAFAAADDNLDLAATWALVSAFARTADQPGGVEFIFLDQAVQARLYRWALDRGTPEAQLAEIFQYPRGKDALAGVVRHWPNHADHIHVRFRQSP